MASLNEFSLISDVGFDNVFIKRYRCEKTHPSITKMYGKLLMTWRIFGAMASASSNDHDDVVRPTHVMSALVMLKTNNMFVLTIPARRSKRNATRHASTYIYGSLMGAIYEHGFNFDPSNCWSVGMDPISKIFIPHFRGTVINYPCWE